MEVKIDKISYDQLVYDALRSMVCKVLKRVERDGLPGKHHFYISFQTQASGVKVPDRMLKRYPKEMTIVLQYQFENLQVDEKKFAVMLYFDDKLEHIIVPWEALIGFTDPHASFSLRLAADGDNPLQQSASEEKNKNAKQKTGQIIDLDSFRNKK